MNRVKKIIIFITAFFVLLCIYWAIGRNVIVKTISSKINEMQGEGYKVVHKGLSVGGFPFKFRANLADADIASPRSLDKSWSIKADDWRIEALSINPLKWTGFHRGDARIDMRGPKGERWLFDARPFNIAFIAYAGFNGELKSFDVSGTKLKTQAVIGTLPPIIAIDEARLNVKPAVSNMRYELHLENIFLEKDTLKELQKIFGPRIESLKGSALAIDLASLEDDAIKNWQKDGQLVSEGWEVSWGGIPFKGGFNLKFADTGLSGIVRIDVENAVTLIQHLQEAGIINASQARQANLAAILLPKNESGYQELTLTLRDGFITLFGQKVFAL